MRRNSRQTASAIKCYRGGDWGQRGCQRNCLDTSAGQIEANVVATGQGIRLLDRGPQRTDAIAGSRLAATVAGAPIGSVGDTIDGKTAVGNYRSSPREQAQDEQQQQ